MGFFFDFGNKTLSTLKKRVLCLTIFFVMFVVGIMCGIILKKQEAMGRYYLSYAGKYLTDIFSGGVGGVLIKRLLSSVLFLAFCLLLGISLIFAPLQGILLFCKGFSFGALILALLTGYGANGFFVFLLVLLPQVLCFCVFGCCSSVLFFDYACFGGIKAGWGGLFKLFFWCTLFFLVAVILEILTVLVVFRVLF